MCPVEQNIMGECLTRHEYPKMMSAVDFSRTSVTSYMCNQPTYSLIGPTE